MTKKIVLAIFVVLLSILCLSLIFLRGNEQPSAIQNETPIKSQESVNISSSEGEENISSDVETAQTETLPNVNESAENEQIAEDNPNIHSDYENNQNQSESSDDEIDYGQGGMFETPIG